MLAAAALCLAQLAFPRDALMRFVNALDLIFRLPLGTGQLPDHLKGIARHVQISSLPHGYRLTDFELVCHGAPAKKPLRLDRKTSYFL
jgi:hypothetical protein